MVLTERALSKLTSLVTAHELSRAVLMGQAVVPLWLMKLSLHKLLFYFFNVLDYTVSVSGCSYFLK
jgi:hypothetical protein